MQIALAQINCTVGDLDGNAQRILAAAEAARSQGASLVVTPELALSGYPPEDLVLRGAFNWACAETLQDLAGKLRGVTAVVGYPQQDNGLVYNAAAVLQDGNITHIYRKYRLPNYSVFDEERYFEPSDRPCVFELDGVKIGVNICEDVWLPGTASAARDAGAELIVVLNASPYHMNKQITRHQVLRHRVAECGLPIIYTDMVGGQDELVFDGASFALNRRGEIVLQLAEFKEQVACIEYRDGDLAKATISPERSVEASVYDALCLAVKDYIGKNGFPGVLLGLSGGIDSALTLCIAVDALGTDKVHAVMMPSQYTADMSLEDAQSMADGLKVKYSVIPIKPVFDGFLATLAPEFKNAPLDTTEENLQARIRGTLLMGLSNKFGAIVLTTGNKSEMCRLFDLVWRYGGRFCSH